MRRKLTFLLLFLPHLLFAGLEYERNHGKQIQLLQAFDVDPNYIHDRNFNEILTQKRAPRAHKYYYNAMQSARLFIPTIKLILDKADVPSEFIYLAMAESAFTTKALSKKRAAGIWQFMPATGRHYGLHIDDYLDERRDPVKSTQAAARYLNVLHNRFGKWYLAAMAYNCGEGCVQRAIDKAEDDDIFTLLDEQEKYLPLETRNYIRKILAYGLMGIDEEELSSSGHSYFMNRASINAIATISLPKGEKISRVAKMLDISNKEMKRLNRHLTYDFVPPFSKKCDIYIPYNKLNSFNQHYKPCDLQKIYLVHVVKSGENLSRIGAKYHVPYKIIKEFNHLSSNNLRIRQKLIIPTTTALLNKHKYHYEKEHYIVRPGDTLLAIAKRYKTSVSKLKKMNHKTSSMLRVSERLAVPPRPHTKKAYIVKSGDNLGTIAKRFKVSVKTLKQRNNKRSDIIRVGEKLHVY